MSELVWSILIVIVAIVAGGIGFKLGNATSYNMLRTEPDVVVKYRVREFTKFEGSNVEVMWTSGNPAIEAAREFMNSVRNSRDAVVRAGALALDGNPTACAYLENMRKEHSVNISEGMKETSPYGRFLAYERAHDNYDVPTPDLIHSLI